MKDFKLPDQNAKLNILSAYLIIDEMVRNQASLFCLSPGHRSSPLAVALTKNKKANYRILIDERASAYFAVGHLKANPQKNFAILICTSGSAVVNYHPAVVEAYYSRLPLLILSADRPPELRETGANQSINQINLFEKYTHAFVDLPCPSLNYPSHYTLSTIDYCMWQARLHQGPVHVNCMFREPFLIDENLDTIISKHQDYFPSSWFKGNRPYCIYEHPIYTPSEEALEKTKKIIDQTTKGIIFVGSGYYDAQTKKNLCQFFELIAWPVFSDILTGGFASETVLPFSLSLLDKFSNFETILIIGDRFVSQAINKFLNLSIAKNKNIIKIFDGFLKSDPSHIVSYHICSNINIFCQKMLKCLVKKDKSFFLSKIKQLSDDKQKISPKQLNNVEEHSQITRYQVAQLLESKMSPKFGLFLANSMSVRLVDELTLLKKKELSISANRGASGIDGNIASASGFSETLQRPVILLIGDLAFLHDLNSLNIITKNIQPMIILLINDNGGGIFSKLTISKYQAYQDIFEEAFITPQNITFKESAKQFNLNYFKAKEVINLSNCLETAIQKIKEKESSIIEIIIKTTNHKLLNIKDKKL